MAERAGESQEVNPELSESSHKRLPVTKRAKCTVQGIVQGVGFRPFVYQLANRYRLTGYVTNTSQGVDMEVEGSPEEIQRFFEALISERPPLAHIDLLHRREIPSKKETGFEIRLSQARQERSTLISPDVCTCADCLSEMRDPGDRRFKYPFINCTNCGPRYTIIMDIPYDRGTTTMGKFRMCPDCEKEYNDPLNRRFHAQPNACWRCGPVPSLHDRQGNPIPSDDAVEETIRLLANGSIVAVKGLGGFHLAVDASNHNAVKRLRRRKHREEKPLAIMVRDLQTAREIAHVHEEEAQILCSRERPIVILNKRRSHGLSPQVAPKNRTFGMMLPYTPLHHRLMEGPYKALVMTSGNMTEEPINIDNQEAFKRLGGFSPGEGPVALHNRSKAEFKPIADYFLIHNRDIYLRSDDTVVRVVDRIPRQIRRSRGYVPVPVFLSREMKKLPSVIAVGAELKNTVCLTKENRAFVSQHVGDMENLETYEFFLLTISHLKRILEIRPKILAHDLHPDYLSSKYAKEQNDLPTVAVQHHHAHIVSCLAEHQAEGPVIGLAMDGTGLGTDGQIWGGDVLLADLCSFKRAGHLEPVPLPGGDAAAKYPWRMALVYLQNTYGDSLFSLPIPFVRNLDRLEAKTILQMAQRGVNSPRTTSCGRLFDAVASLIGLRHKIAYEGQAAIELEMCQNSREEGSYPWQMVKQEDRWILKTGDVIRAMVEDLVLGASKGIVSGRFHNTLMHMFSRVCQEIREETGINEVALSGGCFQNATLLTGLTLRLTERKFKVYSHRILPSNDGCLSLGQAVCAGLRSAGFEGRFASKAKVSTLVNEQ